MKSFNEIFNPFDPNHLNEYFRAKATGKIPDFGAEYAVIGFLPKNWLEIAEDKIIESFCTLLERGAQQDSSETTGMVDIQRLVWYDVGVILKGTLHPEATTLQDAYYKALSAAVKLKQFLVETESYAKIQEKLQ